VLPCENGSKLAKAWQPTSIETCGRPTSCATSFIAENTGRSGQPTQKVGGRTAGAQQLPALSLFLPIPTSGAARGIQVRRVLREELRQAAHQRLDVVLAAMCMQSLPCSFAGASTRRRTVAISCSMNSGWPSSRTRTRSCPCRNR
jgi:hypothetical protein